MLNCVLNKEYMPEICRFYSIIIIEKIEPLKYERRFIMLKIKDVDYLNNYRLALLFSDGVKKEVDLEPYLNGEVFGPLRDINLFVQYGLTPTTIEWANGADLAPEFLYRIGK